MPSPRISAIVSTYNAARYLPSRLENLLAQSVADEMEIIVIDSGSSQNEGEIVNQYKRRHNCISYIRTDREKLYSAWNRAVAVAQGEYLINANTDDRLSPQAYEILASALDQNPQVGLAYSDAWETEDDFDILNFSYLVPPEPNWRLIETPEYSHRVLLLTCYIGAFPMWRRRLHDQFGLFDPTFTVAGDYDFWLRAAEHVAFMRVPKALGLILESPQSILNLNKITLFEEMGRLRRHYFQSPTVPSSGVHHVSNTLLPGQ